MKKLVKSEFIHINTTFKVVEVDGPTVILRNCATGENEIHQWSNFLPFKDIIKVVTDFTETHKLSKTKLALKLSDIHADEPFVVCFKTKEVDERVIIGHKYSNFGSSITGYTSIIDLNGDILGPTKGIKLIDNRNINWLIVNNIKYTSSI